jgi:hypothetical protein
MLDGQTVQSIPDVHLCCMRFSGELLLQVFVDVNGFGKRLDVWDKILVDTCKDK